MEDKTVDMFGRKPEYLERRVDELEAEVSAIKSVQTVYAIIIGVCIGILILIRCL